MLERRLAGVGAVLIEGPKWCGKSTTAAQRAATVLYLNDPSEMRQNLRMADVNPKLLLAGTPPVLIDEWQLAPKLWDAIRLTIRDFPVNLFLPVPPCLSRRTKSIILVPGVSRGSRCGR